LDRFDALILKKQTKNKKNIILMYFSMKNTLKSNHNNTLTRLLIRDKIWVNLFLFLFLFYIVVETWNISIAISFIFSVFLSYYYYSCCLPAQRPLILLYLFSFTGKGQKTEKKSYTLFLIVSRGCTINHHFRLKIWSFRTLIERRWAMVPWKGKKKKRFPWWDY
jgi:hypothetical protein